MPYQPSSANLPLETLAAGLDLGGECLGLQYAEQLP